MTQRLTIILARHHSGWDMRDNDILKADQLGNIEISARGEQLVLLRNTSCARPWARLLARRLAMREARALIVLQGIAGIPKLLDWNGKTLTREWLGGKIMRDEPPTDARYFRDALRLLRQMHCRGIAHNDLAKEANCLMLDNQQPGFIDFQLAWHSPKRSRWFRLLAREDLRHLLKHKRYYCPDALTARQKRLLATPALPSRLWMRYGKPVYHWFTRSMLGWSDREGAGDR